MHTHIVHRSSCASRQARLPVPPGETPSPPNEIPPSPAESPVPAPEIPVTPGEIPRVPGNPDYPIPGDRKGSRLPSAAGVRALHDLMRAA